MQLPILHGYHKIKANSNYLSTQNRVQWLPPIVMPWTTADNSVQNIFQRTPHTYVKGGIAQPVVH
jgi:hypothetical protein